MTVIAGLGGLGAAGRARRAGTTAAGFSVPDEARAGEAAEAGRAAPAEAVGLAGMLALQEDGGAVRDRRARRHGQAMLAELASLQRDLLADGPAPERLARLGELADAMPEAEDARLRGALAEVSLRVRVELARGAARETRARQSV